MINLKLEIEGTTALRGKISISGSKNATLPLMVCSILTDDLLILNNVPNISDVLMLANLLKQVGVEVIYLEDKKRMYLKRNKIQINLQSEDVHKIRASYYIMGALVACRKNFKTSYPGGCSFTKRPIDYHIEAFKSVGYKITENNNWLIFKKKKINNKNHIFRLFQKSVGATINIIYISVIRKASTIIKNPSLEPEVLQVIHLLNKMGAKITILDNDTIEIVGVKKLNGAYFHIMSDRIEAGSYMLLAAAVDKSDIKIENVYLPHLREVIKTLQQLGVNVRENKNSIEIKKDFPLKGIQKKISFYPSFPTDLQQILTVVCTKAITPSIIMDTIYPKRVSHVAEIVKAKGNVEVIHDKIYIYSSALEATNIYAHDLRCGFACIVIGAIAKGCTTIDHVEVILRGYEDLINKLKALGLTIKIM